MVEAPNALRGFGGGWRLGSVLAQPGNDGGEGDRVPIGSLRLPFRDESDYEDTEDGMPERNSTVWRSFSSTIFRVEISSSRNREIVCPGPMRGQRPGREAIDWTLDELGTLLLQVPVGTFRPIFSRPRCSKNRTGDTPLPERRRTRSFCESVIEVFSSRPAVWQAVLGASLSDMDPWEDPQQAIDGLSLKAGTLAQVVYDNLGFEESAGLLAALRRDFSGTTFTLDDVIAAAENQSPGLGPMIEDLLMTTNLPGFIGEEAEAYRMPDGEDGGARYQLHLVVSNGEPTPGLFRVVHYVGSDDDQEREESEPFRIDGLSAVRFSTVLTRPPTGVWVNPYLSLNRSMFRVPMAEVDEEVIVTGDPVEGLAPVDFAVVKNDRLVVDDLDDGFEVFEGGGKGMRLGARDRDDAELDHGLPVDEFGPLPRVWSRATSATAHGRYRHTLAWMRKGKGENRAQFTGVVLDPGPWELEVHLPHKQRFRAARNWGVWKLAIVHGDQRQEIDFDAGEAPRGWNLVDSFDLTTGEVTVEFSDETTGTIVVADAVRWTPIGRSAGEASQ